MIDMRDDHWSGKAKDKYLQGSPTVEQKVLEQILSAGAERIVTNRIPPEGGELYIALVQQGRGSIKFAYELREKHGSPLHFTLRPGEEHLFDTEIDADQDWVQDGLNFVGKYWPA
ncbi:hypothetical protein SLS63_011338 [Diaporthe eres]|uniref:Uncharacterized protein n=1 Tax=Diaporthe eres TaxID=83184 RepID=A0ABR1NU98_DIAER